MKSIEDITIKEAGAKSWFIIGTIAIWVPLALILKGQSANTYLLSFLIGCVPLSIVAYFRPFFNPYSNFLTQRDEDELTAEEWASLKVLKTPRGKRAVLLAVGCVSIFLFSLFLVRNNLVIEMVPLGRHDSFYGGIAAGSVGTAVLTLGYLAFFWSRVLREYIAEAEKRIG